MTIGNLGGIGRLGLARGTGVRASDVTFVDRVAVRPYAESTVGAAAFDAWYGASANYATVFGAHSNWTAYVATVNTVISNYSGDTRPKIWTIGPNVTGTTLAQAAAGSFDSYYTTIASAILADAPANEFIFIRVGHEFNLTGNYPWEVIASGAYSDYKLAFRRVVSAFRAVSSRFRFIWNPNWISTGVGSPSFDVTLCYPGDTYVDVVGNDLYYNSTRDDTDPKVAFEYARDLSGWGLNAQVAFARSHKKALAMCEFGLNWDRPMLFDYMREYMHGNGYAWAGLFDANPDYNWRISDGTYPDAGTRFKAAFLTGERRPLYNDTFYWTADGWGVKGAGTVTRASSQLQINNPVAGNYTNGGQKTYSGLTIGAQYTVRMDINTGGKAAKVNVIEGASPFGNLASNTWTNAMTTKSFTFTAAQATAIIQVLPYAGDAAQVVTVDNILLFQPTP